MDIGRLSDNDWISDSYRISHIAGLVFDSRSPIKRHRLGKLSAMPVDLSYVQVLVLFLHS